MARNRIVVSPMCQYRSVDGMPTEWHLMHLGRYGIGGAGIIFYEETAVEARGRKTYSCAGFYRDDQIPAYRCIAAALRSLGSVPAIQLGHSGAKASCVREGGDWRPLTEADGRAGHAPWSPVSASAVAAGPDRPIPVEMTVEDIRTVIEAWREAARRSHEAGFEICEIHGAHGYLLHQFLSPVSNRRQDAYGGDRNRRMRLALEVVEAVRSVWPTDKPLFFRVSCIDGKGGLWSLEDTVSLVWALKQRGIDLIDCSSGGITGGSTMAAVPRIPGYHVDYAEFLRQTTGVRTMTSGLITEAQQAEDILQHGQADLIGMARELMYHADWPVHAARQLGLADYLALMPPEYAQRLRQRDEQRHAAGTSDTRIPSGIDAVLTGTSASNV